MAAVVVAAVLFGMVIAGALNVTPPATADRPPEQVASAAQQAAQTTAEDRAQRCVEARKRYQTLMDNWRIYEPGPNGERTYLTSDQIDAARANAKQVMDQFCSGQ